MSRTTTGSQWLDWQGLHVFLDAYNANPSSMRASLSNFAGLAGAPKLAILGDMLELGETAKEEHLELGEWAKELPIRELILVGPPFRGGSCSAGLAAFRLGKRAAGLV